MDKKKEMAGIEKATWGLVFVTLVLVCVTYFTTTTYIAATQQLVEGTYDYSQSAYEMLQLQRNESEMINRPWVYLTNGTVKQEKVNSTHMKLLLDADFKNTGRFPAKINKIETYLTGPSPKGAAVPKPSTEQLAMTVFPGEHSVHYQSYVPYVFADVDRVTVKIKIRYSSINGDEEYTTEQTYVSYGDVSIITGTWAT